jgi:hypothetical protein
VPAESLANMPCAIGFAHDFALADVRASHVQVRFQPPPLTFP